MWCCNDVHAVMTYGTSAYYKAAPSPEQRATGVVPLDSLPAAWWNCMWCDTNSAINEARDAIGSFIDEVNTLLTNAGIQPNCNCVDTIYRAVNKIRQTVGDAVTAGAVKSSSQPSEVAIDQTTGMMSVNCLGNAASLTTSARTVVGAVNELKSTYDQCFTDTATAIDGKAPTSHVSDLTTYGVGNADCYGHLKISDQYTSVLAACEGVAASQLAVACVYDCLATIAAGVASLGNTAGCALGTASAGTAVTAARSDHVHPVPSCVACAGDSSKLGGYSASTSATGNTIAMRQGSGYLYATYFNQSSGAESPSSGSYVIYANSDGFFRKSSMANFKSALSLVCCATYSYFGKAQCWDGRSNKSGDGWCACYSSSNYGTIQVCNRGCGLALWSACTVCGKTGGAIAPGMCCSLSGMCCSNPLVSVYYIYPMLAI